MKELIRFTKMEGAGNDYVYVCTFDQEVPAEEKPALAVRLSDRHFGIGSDGLIFINPSERADFEMEMYNADGSSSEMCGNGIRCVARYVYDHGLTDRTAFTVESGGVSHDLQLILRDGKVAGVTVDMGAPILETEKIPVLLSPSPAISVPLEVDGKTYEVTCVSMGNPHCVVFTDDVENLPLEKLGPLFEHHPAFPKRINTEFVQLLGDDTVRMRVWERGAGETMACGTGCCATAAACVLNGVTSPEIKVIVNGGEIFVRWDREQNVIYMTGPAEEVFSGTVPRRADK